MPSKKATRDFRLGRRLVEADRHHRTSQCGITGLSIVYDSGACWLRRIIWLLVITSLLVWLFFQLQHCIERAMAGGTVRSWSHQVVTNITVPAITVCHGNAFKKSQVLRHVQENVTWSDWRRRGFSTLNWTTFDGLDDFYGRVTYQWEDMVMMCRVNGKACRETGTLQQAGSVQHGLCTTFSTNEVVTTRFTGGQIVLYLEEQETLGDFEHDGWLIYFHGPDVAFNDIVLFTGQASRVRVYKSRKHLLKLSRVTTTQQPHTSGCRREASNLQFKLCLGECILGAMHADSTSCSVPWIPPAHYPHGTRSCASFAELRNASRDMVLGISEDDYIRWTRSCWCPPSCTTDQFEIEGQEKWHAAETSLYVDMPWLRNRSMAVLELWLSDVVVHITEVDAYPFQTFMAEVGGSLGLMLGGSLLTLVEFLDCAIHSCWRKKKAAIHSCWRKK
ncbi:uncharacterized protein LOC119092495 [Pollicipes pollicipes]|uniref:uncharacterized protein LOC119092495 n=1 Tax=Pollicipes pollicipes TaxID=41117 RepID=UPI001885A28A|nr:uncharacterized protein LOC119092495 [Pollicipes pollicipes]